jgi:hypothetical protein
MFRQCGDQRHRALQTVADEGVDGRHIYRSQVEKPLDRPLRQGTLLDRRSIDRRGRRTLFRRRCGDRF